jgi:hypothetical protein
LGGFRRGRPLWRPLFYIAPQKKSIAVMTNEQWDQLAELEARVAELRGYL